MPYQVELDDGLPGAGGAFLGKVSDWIAFLDL